MDTLKTVITIALVLISVILTIVILMQEGKQEGLGGLTGSSSSDTYWSKNKSRSMEGALARITKVFVVIFFALSFMLNLRWFN